MSRERPKFAQKDTDELCCNSVLIERAAPAVVRGGAGSLACWLREATTEARVGDPPMLEAPVAVSRRSRWAVRRARTPSCLRCTLSLPAKSASAESPFDMLVRDWIDLAGRIFGSPAEEIVCRSVSERHRP